MPASFPVLFPPMPITTMNSVLVTTDRSDSFKEQYPATYCTIYFISPVQPVVDMHPQVLVEWHHVHLLTLYFDRCH